MGGWAVVPEQSMGWGRCPLPPCPYLLGPAREIGTPQIRGTGLLGWVWGADPRGRRLWGLEPGVPGPRRAARLGHAWHAARGPVGSVCAPRAPIGMREPARRGREAGALAGGAGEAAAEHVLALSFARGRAG